MSIYVLVYVCVTVIIVVDMIIAVALIIILFIICVLCISNITFDDKISTATVVLPIINLYRSFLLLLLLKCCKLLHIITLITNNVFCRIYVCL